MWCEGIRTRLLHHEFEGVGYRIAQQAVCRHIGKDLVIAFDLILTDAPVDMGTV